MWIGQMQRPIVNGPASGCRRKRNGKRRLEGLMAVSIRGATSHQHPVTRIMDKPGRATMGPWHRWDHSKRAKVPMAFMIWPGMSGSGSVTGMTMTITKAASRGIRKDRQRVGSKGFVAALGTAVHEHCALRIGTGIPRHSEANISPACDA